jgi:5-methylcytosine-specific restriction enzyme subunit McrC
MSPSVESITLSEWETLTPADCPTLADRFLDDSVECRRVVDALNKSRMLRLTELKKGIEISAFSHVGRIRVGDLSITVLPKLKSASLLRLLRYAFGFRRLELISDSTHLVEQCGFEDLLISQLNAEAQELISRGLQRAYVPQNERLASPRGRINIDRLALDGGTITATLPCQHHPRVEDILLNRVLMAGLRLAGSLASLVDLRRDSRRLASLLEEQVSSIRLNAAVLDQAARQMTRLTAAYVPSLSIIRLLVEAQGIVLEGKTLTSTLPGFLFDMNTFFQALLSRFLRDNLPNYSVRDEHGLKGMMRYNPKFRRPNRKSPTPRPDYAVLKSNKLVALLDAKYRDLWEKSLPREMLYQLVMYAISCDQKQSAILYPTLTVLAKEERLDVSHPLSGSHLGQVCLRPVNLNRIEELVSADTAALRRERAAYAERLAFGEPASSSAT